MHTYTLTHTLAYVSTHSYLYLNIVFVCKVNVAHTYLYLVEIAIYFLLCRAYGFLTVVVITRVVVVLFLLLLLLPLCCCRCVIVVVVGFVISSSLFTY